MGGCSGDTVFGIVGGVEEGFDTADDFVLFGKGRERDLNFYKLVISR